ncbi:hypothetical protein [uncultured Serinicoccus sp.]|uniref:hypothetical protein n=1 Tax=uncultured Serinicoccus sp. TaxID=735514 RepID=UPI00261091DB|nr:hypothetical protein [uncultured Serinicoccus sp.]
MTASTTRSAGTQPRPATTPLGRPFGAHLGAVGLANLADGVVQIGVPLLAVTLTRHRCSWGC